MLRLIITFATILTFSSYAFALPEVVDFTGTIDNSWFMNITEANNTPGAPEIASNNSTIFGSFVYDPNTTIPGGTYNPNYGYPYAKGTASDFFISINNKYTYQAPSLPIGLSGYGIYPGVFINGSLSAITNYGLPPTLDIALNLMTTSIFNVNTELFDYSLLDWNNVYRTGEQPAIMITGADNTVIDFTIQMTENPVPEPSTFILFGAGIIGVVFLRKKFKVHA
jgi:hypothetical protein